MIDPRIIGLAGQTLLASDLFSKLALTILINRQNGAFYPFFTEPGTQIQMSQNINTFFQPINKDLINNRILYTDSINNTAPKMTLNLKFGKILFRQPGFSKILDLLRPLEDVLRIFSLQSAPIMQSMLSMQETLYPGNEATWAIISYLGNFWPRVGFETATFSVGSFANGALEDFSLELTATHIQDVDMSQFYTGAK